MDRGIVALLMSSSDIAVAVSDADGRMGQAKLCLDVPPT